MVWLVLLFIFALILARCFNRLTPTRSPDGPIHTSTGHCSYRPCPKGLLTPTEWEFYLALRSALPSALHVWAKPRLADVVEPNPWTQSAFNRISAKHLDFVITAPGGRVLAAIELDDRSHSRVGRKAKDRVKHEALESARIPLFRFSASPQYDLTILRLHFVEKAA